MREAFRASIAHCRANSAGVSEKGSHPQRGQTPFCQKGSDPFVLEYFEDGLVVVEDGLIVEAGDASALLPQLGEAVSVTD
jgi:hypothetical protein